jgi:DNA polymerase-3 subunit alpha
LLEPGKAIFIKAGFQKGWRDDGLELKIKEVSLLESIGETMTKGVRLTLPLDRLTPEIVNGLDKLCEKHQGQHQLRMVLVDRQNRIKLPLAAKMRKVKADNEFVTALSKLGVDYKIER